MAKKIRFGHYKTDDGIHLLPSIEIQLDVDQIDIGWLKWHFCIDYENMKKNKNSEQ